MALRGTWAQNFYVIKFSLLFEAAGPKNRGKVERVCEGLMAEKSDGGKWMTEKEVRKGRSGE